MIKDWNGLKVILPRKNDAYTFKEVLGEFNQYCFDEWSHLLQKKDTIIDLGAHIGLFSLATCRQVNQVIAIEPDEENFCYLMDNICENQIQNITALKKAIAINNGESTINTSVLSPARHSFYHNAFLNRNGIGCFESLIETISLDALFEKYQISFCKVIKADIEGAEYEVFLNCSEEILKKVGILLIEYHEEVTPYGKKELSHRLSKLDFQVHLGESINYGGLIGGSIRAYNKVLFR